MAVNSDVISAVHLARQRDPSVKLEITVTKQGAYQFTVTTKECRVRCRNATAQKAAEILCAIAKVEPCALEQVRGPVERTVPTWYSLYQTHLHQAGFTVIRS